MKKLFISQPVKGKRPAEVCAEYERAVERVESYLGEKVEIIGSFFDDECTSLELLAESIASLAKADIAYFAEGWERFRGCRIEHECAQKYGLLVFEMCSRTYKTRQSELLKLFPNASTTKDVLAICPRMCNDSFECPYDCEACRRDFWLEEIE